MNDLSLPSTAWRRWLPGVAATCIGGHLFVATIARWWTIFLNDLSLLSTALAAVATWRCCYLYWRPPLRSHHRQMVDDFLE
ncbi:MAG: hypothetical protein ACK56R_11985, partial [Pirellulaceae bacterium]